MVTKIRSIGLDEGRAHANKELGGGRTRAECLADALAPHGKLWLSLVNQEEFFNLVVQETDETRHITARTIGRTLLAVAELVRREYSDLNGIGNAAAIEGELHPQWWQRCAEIAEDFDWNSFGRVWLVPTEESERTTEDTVHYICEGQHRSIAAAVLLLEGSIEWTDAEAVVAEERLNCC